MCFFLDFLYSIIITIYGQKYFFVTLRLFLFFNFFLCHNYIVLHEYNVILKQTKYVIVHHFHQGARKLWRFEVGNFKKILKNPKKFWFKKKCKIFIEHRAINTVQNVCFIFIIWRDTVKKKCFFLYFFHLHSDFQRIP